MIEWLLDMFSKPWPPRHKEEAWRYVPNPNWRCSRRRLGGDYW